MKKIFTILSVVAVSAMMNAQATEVLNEQFSFTGFLNTGNNGWYMHSGTLNQLAADGSVVTLVSGNNQDSNKALSTPYVLGNNSASKVDYSVDIKVLNDIGLTGTGDYVLSLTGTVTTSDVSTGISALPARLFVKKGTSGYLLGTVSNTVNTGGGVSWTTIEIPYGVQVNAKVTYEVTKDAAGTLLLQRSTLTVGTETVTNTAGTLAPPAQIAGIAIREGGNTGNLTFDNLIVNTYAPTSLAVTDFDVPKINLVKNTNVNNTIVFGVNANVQIVNVSGQLVKSASVTENSTLDVSSLTKGMYIVTAEVNGQKVSQKVIKN
jgi:hypothetical protein